MLETSQSEKRAVLPFALMVGGSGAQEFPEEMTYAAILADVEKRRAKAGVIRKIEENVTFVSMVYWPIVAVPWREGRHLVFDGMAVWSHVFEDHRIPSTEAFMRALDECKNYKEFVAKEASHSSYFREFVDVERLPVMGMFIHEEFMKDLLNHIALARPREGAYASFLEPRLSISDVGSSVNRIANLATFGRKEIEGLSKAKENLRSAVEKFREEVNKLVDVTRRKYQDKINSVKPDVEAKVAQLEKKRDEMWSMMQPRLITLQSEARRLESEESHWAQESRRREASPEVQLKARERLTAAKSELDKARSDVQKHQEEMSKVRTGYDQQIQDQWERIRSLERERDTEVSRLIDEQRGMTQQASRIFQDIDTMSRKKEDEIAFIESQGVQIPSSVSSEVLYMPLMVCLLQAERGIRYMVYPPMITKSGKGVIGGIQSIFGGLVLPLEPKTRQFEEVFRTGVERALSQDQSLSTYIGSVSMSANILHRQDLPAMLTKGLAGLKSQGWIKDRHERELLVSLQKHISMAASSAPRK